MLEKIINLFKQYKVLSIEDLKEKLNIEVDMEVADNDEGLHRCQFYVKTQLENLKHFRNHLPRIFSKDYRREIKLHHEFN